jgi:DNA-directed RNA polymerase specialized sigma24 family protein
VAQEAFVRLLDRKVEGERPALRVWLFTVATHLIRDRWRVVANRSGCSRSTR